MTGLNDAFNTGWNGSIGLTWNIKPEVGIQVEYMYDRLGGPDRAVRFQRDADPGGGTQSGIIESNHQVHTGTFNLVYTPHLAANERPTPIGVYVLGGGGVYHRLIQLTSPSVGYATVCDPYWYVCYPSLVPVDRIIGDRSSNDFGINFGAGVTFGADAKFYVETRYHYVWGPDGSTRGRSAQRTDRVLDQCGLLPADVWREMVRPLLAACALTIVTTAGVYAWPVDTAADRPADEQSGPARFGIQQRHAGGGAAAVDGHVGARRSQERAGEGWPCRSR